MRSMVALLRPHQWIKNLFVAAPLFFTPSALSPGTAARVALGVACFSSLASAMYVLNDWCDREADRQHPVKCKRPLASGEVSSAAALWLALLLAALGLLLALLLLPRSFGAVLAGYAALNLAYSFRLKRIAIVDVMVIAIGFVLRVYAGGFIIAVTPTVWIIACTLLLALFLALAKRRDDIVRGFDENHRPSLAGYNQSFLDTAVAVVLAALLVCYLLYTTEPANMARMHSDKLFLTAPFVIAGVLRYLQITIVEHRSGSPTRLALSDRFLMLAILGWIATFAWLIYA
ncbi:MAG TPA: decaprenyl-phosphate phosphoribosyltransferase [Dongiaceae bacterium]|nr:decaprenyl-phosphate phosphoribosyltransferase [Dongiaceae bacterium]